MPDEVCEHLRADLRQFLNIRPDVGMLDLTHHSTLSDAAGKNFLNGHLPGGREVVGELRRVLELAQAGEILPPGGARNGSLVIREEARERIRRVGKKPNFYETETVRRVAEVLDYCTENCTIGVITADFGAGKSEGVRAWRRERPKVESLIYEFDEYSSSNKVDFIRELAEMLHLEVPPGSQTGGKIFRTVCERLREVPCLLIFDQCETLRARIFQVIRQVWDRCHECGVGVVLLSAPILLTRMTMSRVADLGALTSRVGVWAPLSGLSRAEMAAIVKQEGIVDVDEVAFDHWWRLTGGSMRRLMRAIDLLRSKHAGRRVTEKTIVTMAGCLWGVQARGEAA
jgi:DNA transposition AAA+ family ATPase